ncbi:hypothetical protein NLI96_g4069 [Meripilus lineatus]|uniref:Uncharacterized protein n=1 Tax=Meripilus lineatus TaxID=2056292 RepID=A0AAD5YK97_9APHY|nr:hypothetical protein NLI96_g4069 [Physisporinus lineatus]
MYLAGIEPHQILQRLPISHNQGVESIAWITTLSGMIFSATLGKKASKETKVAGPANTSSLTPFQKALTPIHSLSIWGPPAVYVITTAFNRMEQPDWFADWELPRGDLSVGWHAGLRTLGCLLNVGGYYFLSQCFKHLGSQWHFIGVSVHF